MTATRAARRFTVKGWDGTEQTTTLAELLSQVTALSHHSTEIYKNEVQKRQDLRKRQGKRRSRPVLTEPGDRMKKLGIETGYDTRRDLFLTAPLEPWTCPDPGGMRLYTRIMRGDDGATVLGDYQPGELRALEWMRDEELVTFGEQGQVHALGDASPRERRTYPGAPVADRKAGIGRQLRHRGAQLVLAAFCNIVRRRPRKRISAAKRAAMDRPHGISIAAYDLCAEVNAIKSRRRDLDEYRYMSLSTCREIVRDLLKAGLLSEAEPPKAIRVQRSWRTIPRVFEVPPELAGAPERGTRRKTRQKEHRR